MKIGTIIAIIGVMGCFGAVLYGMTGPQGPFVLPYDQEKLERSREIGDRATLIGIFSFLFLIAGIIMNYIEKFGSKEKQESNERPKHLRKSGPIRFLVITLRLLKNP